MIPNHPALPGCTSAWLATDSTHRVSGASNGICRLGGILLATVVGAYNWGTPGPWVLVAAPVLMLLRSVFFGVYVNGTAIKIVSWYWTYVLERRTVRDVKVLNYNGWVNRWSGGTDMYGERAHDCLRSRVWARKGFPRDCDAALDEAVGLEEDLRSTLGMVDSWNRLGATIAASWGESLSDEGLQRDPMGATNGVSSRIRSTWRRRGRRVRPRQT